MAEETKTVAFRIDKEKHENWSDYADENPEYDSLSHLIRRGVAREIAMDGEPRNTNSRGSVDEKQLGELLDTVEKIHGRLDGVEGAVSDATDAMHASQGVDEQLPIDVFDALPVGKDNGVTAEELAKTTGRKDASVRFALENLRRNTGTVGKVTPLDQDAGIEKEPRWYKVEGA